MVVEEVRVLVAAEGGLAAENGGGGGVVEEEEEECSYRWPTTLSKPVNR